MSEDQQEDFNISAFLEDPPVDDVISETIVTETIETNEITEITEIIYNDKYTGYFKRVNELDENLDLVDDDDGDEKEDDDYEYDTPLRTKADIFDNILSDQLSRLRSLSDFSFPERKQFTEDGTQTEKKVEFPAKESPLQSVLDLKILAVNLISVLENLEKLVRMNSGEMEKKVLIQEIIQKLSNLEHDIKSQRLQTLSADLGDKQHSLAKSQNEVKEVMNRAGCAIVDIDDMLRTATDVGVLQGQALFVNDVDNIIKVIRHVSNNLQREFLDKCFSTRSTSTDGSLDATPVKDEMIDNSNVIDDKKSTKEDRNPNRQTEVDPLDSGTSLNEKGTMSKSSVVSNNEAFVEDEKSELHGLGDGSNQYMVEQSPENSDVSLLETPVVGGQERFEPNSDDILHETPELGGPERLKPNSDISLRETPEIGGPERSEPNSDVIPHETPELGGQERSKPNSDVSPHETPELGGQERSEPNSDVIPHETPELGGQERSEPNSDVSPHETPELGGQERSEPNSDVIPHETPELGGQERSEPNSDVIPHETPELGGQERSKPNSNISPHETPELGGQERSEQNSNVIPHETPELGGQERSEPNSDVIPHEIQELGGQDILTPKSDLSLHETPEIGGPEISKPNSDGSPQETPELGGLERSKPNSYASPHETPELGGQDRSEPNSDVSLHETPEMGGPERSKPNSDVSPHETPELGGQDRIKKKSSNDQSFLEPNMDTQSVDSFNSYTSANDKKMPNCLDTEYELNGSMNDLLNSLSGSGQNLSDIDKESEKTPKRGRNQKSIDKSRQPNFEKDAHGDDSNEKDLSREIPKASLSSTDQSQEQKQASVCDPNALPENESGFKRPLEGTQIADTSPPREGEYGLCDEPLSNDSLYEDPLYNGPFSDGPLYEPPFHDGQFSNGPLSEDSLYDYPFSDGPYFDAPFHDCSFSDGKLSDRPFSEGTLSEAPFHDVPLSDGPLSEAPFHDVPFSEGPLSEAPIHDGSFSNGPLSDRPFSDGPLSNGQPSHSSSDEMPQDKQHPKHAKPNQNATENKNNDIPKRKDSERAFPMNAENKVATGGLQGPYNNYENGMDNDKVDYVDDDTYPSEHSNSDHSKDSGRKRRNNVPDDKKDNQRCNGMENHQGGTSEDNSQRTPFAVENNDNRGNRQHPSHDINKRIKPPVSDNTKAETSGRNYSFSKNGVNSEQGYLSDRENPSGNQRSSENEDKRHSPGGADNSDSPQQGKYQPTEDQTNDQKVPSIREPSLEQKDKGKNNGLRDSSRKPKTQKSKYQNGSFKDEDCGIVPCLSRSDSRLSKGKRRRYNSLLESNHSEKSKPKEDTSGSQHSPLPSQVAKHILKATCVAGSLLAILGRFGSGPSGEPIYKNMFDSLSKTADLQHMGASVF